MDWREREKGREVREAKGERERENEVVCFGLGKKKMAFPLFIMYNVGSDAMGRVGLVQV